VSDTPSEAPRPANPVVVEDVSGVAPVDVIDTDPTARETGVDPVDPVNSDDAPIDPDDGVDRGWVERFVDEIGAPELVLFAMFVVWSGVFIHLPKLRYDRYGTFGFDLGIYDQGVWLLSRFHDPFVTIRGLELFGHHANLILLLLVPGYWLGGGPIFLLVVQVLAQASGGVALYLLGRDLLRSRWAGVGIAAAFYLNPTNQWLTWEFFHPDAVAIGPMLFAYWAARTKRWGFFWVAFALALACKEDAALSLAVLGVFVIFWGDKRRGSLIAIISTAWFFFATRVLIPFENGVGPFYDTFFGSLGSSPTAVLFNSVRHPTETWKLASAGDAKAWYWKMWAPWALMPLLDLRIMLIAAPMIFIDVLSSFPYTRVYQYHYSALVLVGSALATVEAIKWISRKGKSPDATRNGLVVIVMVAALLGSISWGAAPIARQYRSGIWPLLPDARAAAKDEAIRLLPPQASVSTAYNLDTHLTHRAQVYEFPVPWCNINWGVNGEHLDNPATVQWLLIDRQLLTSPRDKALFDDLLTHEFKIRYEKDDIVLAQRVAAPLFPAIVNPPVGQCYPRPALAPYQS
jgi:uncharacterized membrane protein